MESVMKALRELVNDSKWVKMEKLKGDWWRMEAHFSEDIWSSVDAQSFEDAILIVYDDLVAWKNGTFGDDEDGSGIYISGIN